MIIGSIDEFHRIPESLLYHLSVEPFNTYAISAMSIMKGQRGGAIGNMTIRTITSHLILLHYLDWKVIILFKVYMMYKILTKVFDIKYSVTFNLNKVLNNSICPSWYYIAKTNLSKNSYLKHTHREQIWEELRSVEHLLRSYPHWLSFFSPDDPQIETKETWSLGTTDWSLLLPSDCLQNKDSNKSLDAPTGVNVFNFFFNRTSQISKC